MESLLDENILPMLFLHHNVNEIIYNNGNKAKNGSKKQGQSRQFAV